MLSSATSSDWSRFQSAPSCSSGWQRSFYVRLKNFYRRCPDPACIVCEFTSKTFGRRSSLRTRQLLLKNFWICRVFVAFSGLILAYKNEKTTICTAFSTVNRWFFGALEGTRIPGPLIKRIQGASFVKFQKFEETIFLSCHRKTRLCAHRIICTQCNTLQPLSSYSGVQKVCKNVQTGKTKPNGQINHRFYGRV